MNNDQGMVESIYIGESDFDPDQTYNEISLSCEWKKYKSQEYVGYREDWTRIPRDKISTGFPIHLDIETTTYCNLKCPMCPRTVMVDGGMLDEANGYMTREEFAKIIDEGIDNGVQSIKINYLGEPLFHKDVYWQVEYAKKKGVLDVLMNTNGVALTPKNSRRLLEAGIDGVFVSLDAINPIDYERQRVGANLGHVIDNIYGFSRLRAELRPSCQFRVSMVMYQDKKWIDQFKAMGIMFDGIVDGIGYGFYVEHNNSASGEHPDVPGFYCAQPFQRMFLKFNGNVTICCFDSVDEVVMGNWREQSLYDIWNSEDYAEIRMLHATGRYHEMSLCIKCYFPVSKKRDPSGKII